ncbi:tetratricopeptide repeat protein [Alienimonas sp. DA493]|uniref:tetratricopeptide repeat protein n=1 Tax=Alienimonas sp. DA493 TaxID=3373605 RepID=UPI00375484EA
MAADAYAPCPYCLGTGRKRKFCRCTAVEAEMAAVGKLRERGQTAKALEKLADLDEKHPHTPAVESTRATLLVNDGKAEQAVEILDAGLAEDPSNALMLALHASASLAAKGFTASRQPIWRAFRKSVQFYPDLVSGMAAAAANELYNRRRYPAAREHLACSLRFASQERKQQLFMRLMEFDGNAEIPYPLRSVHPLKDVEGEGGAYENAAKARRIAESGCYGAAADRYAATASDLPGNAAVRANLGYCRAFDGDHKAATGALRKAAEAESNFEIAAEHEAIAQLLALTEEGGTVDLKERIYAPENAAKLLSELDAHDRFHRLPDDPDPDEAPPAGVYEVLDRPLPPSSEDLTADAVPHVVGELTVFAQSGEDGSGGPRAVLSSFEGEEWDAAEAVLNEIGVPLAAEGEQPPGDEDGRYGLPKEMWGLRWRWAFPNGVSLRRRRELESAEWNRRITQEWPETPLNALGGKTPNEAKGDAALAKPLAGALYVLDAVCDRGRYELDLNALREQFDLPKIELIEPPADAVLNSYSILQLQRADLSKLDDRQLLTVLNRVLLVHPARFLRAALTEALSREGLKEQFDRQRAYHTLGELARDRYDYEEAYEWLEKGREEAKQAENAFEAVFRWDTRELALRLETPEDPELMPLIERLDRYYGPKLPQFRPYLLQILAAHEVTPPRSIGTTQPDGASAAPGEADGGATSPGGVWTPDSASAAGESKKLWVPGS